jgi:hypothetical protein
VVSPQDSYSTGLGSNLSSETIYSDSEFHGFLCFFKLIDGIVS